MFPGGGAGEATATELSSVEEKQNWGARGIRAAELIGQCLWRSELHRKKPWRWCRPRWADYWAVWGSSSLRRTRGDSVYSPHRGLLPPAGLEKTKNSRAVGRVWGSPRRNTALGLSGRQWKEALKGSTCLPRKLIVSLNKAQEDLLEHKNTTPYPQQGKDYSLMIFQKLLDV